jgi:hypothetical protein
MSRIDQWLQGLELAFSQVGNIAPWPMHIGAVAPYFSDLEAADLFTKIKVIAAKPDSVKILSRLLISPGVAKATLMDLIIGLKVTKPIISAEKRVWFVEKVFDAIEQIQAGDIFCLDSTNQILTHDEAQRLFVQTPWMRSGDEKDFSHSVYKVSASAKALLWSLYFYGWDDVGYELHGPYPVKSKSGQAFNMVVTDYFDLKPDLLWQSMSGFPYRHITVRVLYQPTMDCRVDMFDHLISRDNLLKNTTACFLEVDGETIESRDTAEDISGRILRQVSRQHELVKVMNRRAVILKFIETRYYALRKWRIHFGEDWKPPADLIAKRIKEIGYINIPQSDEDSGWDELKKAFDPRTNVVPGQSS